MSKIEDSNKPIFNDLTSESPITEVESLCMNCYKNVSSIKTQFNDIQVKATD
jgi:hypothetical protein